MILKNCIPCTAYVSEINNTHIDNTKDIDVVMPMYNPRQHSNNYSKAPESLFRYYGDIPALNSGAIVDFTNDNTMN